MATFLNCFSIFIYCCICLVFLLKYAKKLGAKRLKQDELIFKLINQLSNGMKYIRISGLIDRQRSIITNQSKKLAKANESIGINESLFKTLSEALFFSNEEIKIKIPKSVNFPINHLNKLIAKAKKNETIFQSKIFDFQHQ